MSRLFRNVRNLTVAAAATVALSCAPNPAATPGAVAELAGRTAGASQSCVPIEPTQNLRVVDSRTVLYGSGHTVWLNHLRTECPGMDRMDILATEPRGTQYCSGDPVRSLDPVSKVPGPVCVLGDFVPYRL
jgi:hypothetical protein